MVNVSRILVSRERMRLAEYGMLKFILRKVGSVRKEKESKKDKIMVVCLTTSIDRKCEVMEGGWFSAFGDLVGWWDIRF